MLKKLLIIFVCLLIAGDVCSQVLQLRKPIGGTVWPGYSKQMIEWTSENIDNIKIESSLDSGRTWQLIVSSYPASAQRYEWEVPNKTSDSCFIRLTDVNNASTSSSNFKNNPFKIPAPGITVDSLTAVFTGGTIQPISWVSSGVRKVNIYVSYDNQVSYQKIADTAVATLFYYNWRVPLVVASNVYLKIEDAENTSLFGIVPQAIQITHLRSINTAKYKGGIFDGHSSANNRSRLLQLIGPAVADSAFGGELRTLRWKQNNVEQVTIRFSADSGSSWTTIIEQYPAASGAYDWTVPNMPTKKGWFRIIDAKDSTAFDHSDSVFTIRKKILTITDPVIDKVVGRGTVIPINWNSGGIQYLKIHLLSQGQLTLLKDSVPAIRETFNQIITQNMSSTIRFVLTDISDSTTRDTSALLTLQSIPVPSSAKFKGGYFDGHAAISNVTPRLQMSEPKPGDTLSVAARYSIVWKAFNLDRVHIRYSADSGLNWIKIADQVSASAGSFEWKTPAITGNKYRIKIMDAFDTAFHVVTAGSFVLAPKKLIQTTDSSNWIRATPKLIEWTAAGIDSVRIEYRLTSSGNWIKIKDSIPATQEAAIWIVPSIITDSVQIRVADIADSVISHTRTFKGPFNTLVQQVSAQKFRGGAFDGHSLRSNINKIIVQKPVENEVLTGGTIYTIKWSTINLQDSIMLQYSVDSGATWITIARALASNGQYDWRIPTRLSVADQSGTVVIGSNSVLKQVQNTNASSNKCLIRALDISSGNTLVGISSKPFTITVGDAPLQANIDFPVQKDTTFNQAGMILRMNAISTSGQKIQYLLSSTYAVVKGDSVIVQSPGTITIGAFALGANGYLNSDTIYRTFCVLPPQPVLNYQGSASFCGTDSLLLSVNASEGTFVWRRNDTTMIGAQGFRSVRIISAGIYTVDVVMNGCSNRSLPLTILQTAKPVAPIISGPTNLPILCEGDSILLTSSQWKTKWFLNGVLLTDTSKVLSVRKAGMYQAVSGVQNCVSDTSNTIQLIFNAKPDSIQATTLEFCQGANPVIVSVPKTRGFHLMWYTNPQGGTGSTQSPVVSVQQAGVSRYYVTQKNINTGCESIRTPITVLVKPAPVSPTIQRIGDSLFTQPATQYQWYLNNRMIQGSHSILQPVISRGLYRVEVRKDSSCWISSPVYYVQRDPEFVASMRDYQATVYPNPSAGQFFIQVKTTTRYSGYATITITDVNGQSLWNAKRYVLNESSWKIPVNIRLSKGINTVTIRLNGYIIKNISLIGL